MRILLDECVNPRIRLAFPADEVKTVSEMGWCSLSNGKLINAASPHFDVFVTLDQNLQFQNPTARYPLGILVLVSHLNTLKAYRPQFAEIRDSAMRAKPGQVNVVYIG